MNLEIKPLIYKKKYIYIYKIKIKIKKQKLDEATNLDLYF